MNQYDAYDNEDMSHNIIFFCTDADRPEIPHQTAEIFSSFAES
jgi:hypothetical protein